MELAAGAAAEEARSCSRRCRSSARMLLFQMTCPEKGGSVGVCGGWGKGGYVTEYGKWGGSEPACCCSKLPRGRAEGERHGGSRRSAKSGSEKVR